MTRTAETIRREIAETRDFERELIEQAGAMGLADTGTRLTVQGLYQRREALAAELAAVERGETPPAATGGVL